MSELRFANTAQGVKSLTFSWNYNDTLENTLGNQQDFGSANTAAAVGTPDADSHFTIGYLPRGAVIVGGAIVRTTAFDTAGYDIEIGDADDADEYFATADLKAAGISALVPTGIPCLTANQRTIRMSVANDDVCTAGAAYVRVDYIVPGRADEVTQPGA